MLNDNNNSTKKHLVTPGAIFTLVIGVAVIGIYLSQTPTISLETNQTNQQTLGINTDKQEVTYSGSDGITALALLEKTATIKMSGSGEMAFVTEINGITPDSSKNQFWAFEVNGQSATVGAGSYITKASDTITWKLSSY
jgi:hypothetical protein